MKKYIILALFIIFIGLLVGLFFALKSYNQPQSPVYVMNQGNNNASVKVDEKNDNNGNINNGPELTTTNVNSGAEENQEKDFSEKESPRVKRYIQTEKQLAKTKILPEVNLDSEVCDGVDNDGDGKIDEEYDSNTDGVPDSPCPPSDIIK